MAEGVNPNYLKTALQQARSETSSPDHMVGSGTHSGTATPRPDLTDKRLPGIIHGYFSQNTPPLTPRALSIEPADASKQGSPLQNSQQVSDSSQTPRTTPPVSLPKGKLSVKIVCARGLRPSVAPYAVCAFEWLETIAHRPQSSSGAVEMSRDASSEGPLSKAVAIPMKSRQSSQASHSDRKAIAGAPQVTDPRWDHEAIFDFSGRHSEVEISVYNANQDLFLGQVRVIPDVFGDRNQASGWFSLSSRAPDMDQVTGEIYLEFHFQRVSKKQYGPKDFHVLKLIGKGTFGQVYQVYKKDTKQVFAMKKLSKKVIVQKKEVAHTIGERNILVRTASTDSPFIVGLRYSFQTTENLYLVTGFMSGGELFYHLQKEGRFGEERAKFYIAELILALEHLHKFNIVYRDLKPENILLDATGHVALCDFGLSKANLAQDETTNTFCGTTEYLAPEVLLDDQGYTKMVDFWSLGVLVFEMCCGWSPFYADEIQQMYKNIAFGKVRFPRETLSAEGRNFVKSLLNRNPRHRLGAQRDADELKEHVFFAGTDWDLVQRKVLVPPFKPKLKNILDVSNFDPEFTNEPADNQALHTNAADKPGQMHVASTPLSPGMQAKFEGFTFVDESKIDDHFSSANLDRMDEESGHASEAEDHANRMSGITTTSTQHEDAFHSGQFGLE